MTEEVVAAGTAEPADRKNIRKFFTFPVLRDEVELKPVQIASLVLAGIIGLVVGGLWAGPPGALILGLAAAGGAYFLDRQQAEANRVKENEKVGEQHVEFVRLARETRLIRSRDVTRAIVRVFERTQLDRAKLLRFEDTYVFEEEKNLLADETREQKLGDLLNKSIRMISPAEYKSEKNGAFRPVFWKDTKEREIFFNPTRLVVLFLTETQLVICDVWIDSVDGSLREEIQRVALNKIVNIRFVAARNRFPPNREEFLRWAENLGYEDDLIAEIKRSSDKELDEKWTIEEMRSTLSISRTDGGAISMPIRSEYYFGGPRSALDDDASLNEDEIKVDRMINELNRVVEHG